MSFVAVQLANGYGRHEAYLSPQERIMSKKYSLLTIVTLVLSTCFAKISICFFALRLLGIARARKRKTFLYMCIAVLLFGNLIDVISVLVQCRPVTKIWNPGLPGSCWHPSVQQKFAYMQGGWFEICEHRISHTYMQIGLSISTAFVLSALPVLIFRDLQINKRTKVVLCLLMGLGVLYGPCPT